MTYFQNCSTGDSDSDSGMPCSHGRDWLYGKEPSAAKQDSVAQLPSVNTFINLLLPHSATRYMGLSFSLFYVRPSNS